MASRHRTNAAPYRTYGSVAYAPVYEGGAVRTPQQGEAARPRPRVRTRERALTRTKVQVREAGEVSIFAVVGFLAVGVLAALLIWSYAQFTMANDQLIATRNTLNDLQDEHIILAAQYEKVFDMARIQEAVGDTMVRPISDQVVYLDLSEPDNVVLYGEGERVPGLAGLWNGIQEIAGKFFAYFR